MKQYGTLVIATQSRSQFLKENSKNWFLENPNLKLIFKSFQSLNGRSKFKNDSNINGR